jgi:hypothetical protein
MTDLVTTMLRTSVEKSAGGMYGDPSPFHSVRPHEIAIAARDSASTRLRFNARARTTDSRTEGPAIRFAEVC